jgi:uncharacterized protein YjbI with pentapeptide repeats
MQACRLARARFDYADLSHAQCENCQFDGISAVYAKAASTQGVPLASFPDRELREFRHPDTLTSAS